MCRAASGTPPAFIPAMSKQARDADVTSPPSTTEKLEELYQLIDGIEIAMLTTRTLDGALVSRPMQTQARRAGTDLWFMTSTDTMKIEELAFDPHVNLAYYKDGSREYVSVSGTARVTRDREMIHQLYKPDWKAWLGDEGGARNGGPDDPRIALIDVQAESATYLKSTDPRLITLFKVAKAIVTGMPPRMGNQGQLSADELLQGEPRASSR
jgi:general stress protein 26